MAYYQIFWGLVILIGGAAQVLLSTAYAIGHTRWDFAAITDLDLNSKSGETHWRSLVQSGTLRKTNKTESGEYTIDWKDRVHVEADVHHKGRGMETSALEYFNGEWYTFCDRSGHVFTLDFAGNKAESVYQLQGDTPLSKSPFKTEWSTIKDGILYAGSIGKEWTNEKGEVVHKDLNFVYTLDSSSPDAEWQITDWTSVYSTLRDATESNFPGYLIMEAVTWDPHARQWLFLPRKISNKTPFADETDELKGANTLIILDEEFKLMRTVSVGPAEKEWGFSSISLLPHHFQSADEPSILVGIKIKELAINGNSIESKIAVFDTNGNMKSSPEFFPFPEPDKDELDADVNFKYEGLAFAPKPRLDIIF